MTAWDIVEIVALGLCIIGGFAWFVGQQGRCRIHGNRPCRVRTRHCPTVRRWDGS